VVLGIAGGVALQLNAASPNWVGAVVVGIGLGLSAIGLYSGTTTVATTYAARQQSAPTADAQTPAQASNG
jgi:hypothetical protein